MKKNAFTLIEIIIVVSVIMVIMVSMGGIMSGVFTSQNKNKASDKITQNGAWIKKNILNADSSNSENGGKFTCPMSPSYGSSIVITNIKDGEKTTISCFNTTDEGYKIASVSGKAVGTTVFLFQKNNDFVLTDCSNFVTCSTLPSLQLSSVKFNFSLGAGMAGFTSQTNKDFSIDLTLRN